MKATKAAAQMVALDDNVASIAAAVHEGRTVYDDCRSAGAVTMVTLELEKALMRKASPAMSRNA